MKLRLSSIRKTRLCGSFEILEIVQKFGMLKEKNHQGIGLIMTILY